MIRNLALHYAMLNLKVYVLIFEQISLVAF